MPYIVNSRSSIELINNLLADNFPILFEGLHSCFYLTDPRLSQRKKIVRMHNVEHTYYANLAQIEKNIFKRRYFYSEARKLEKYEAVLQCADVIAAISQADEIELSKRYKNVVCISAFHPHNKVNVKEGKGNFILYHGNLKVSENNRAALYLVKEVLNDVDTPFIIAGSGASNELKQALSSKPHMQLKEILSSAEMYELVHNAHINILPTFQATGIKLKLIAALYTGRFCLVNLPMVKNTGLEELCIISESAQAMKREAKSLMQTEFTKKEAAEREVVLNKYFSNEASLKKIIELL